MFFILQGKGLLHIGKKSDAFSVCENDIFVINPFELYTLSLAPDALVLSLSISQTAVSDFYNGLPAYKIHCRSYLYDQNNQAAFSVIRKDLAYMFQVQYKNEPHLQILLRSRAGVLLADLIKYFGVFKNKETENTRESFDALRTATDFIQKAYANEISLKDLAKETFLSTSYLSHLFQKHLGKNFLAYLSDVRLVHAIYILNSGKSVTEVAQKVGFPSSNAFIHAFKNRYGMTPGQYKKQGVNRTVSAISPEDTEGFSLAFTALIKYIESDKSNVAAEAYFNEVEISCDTTRCKQTLKHNWRTCINAGYAKDLFQTNVQSQLIQVQREIGYQYIRCKGYLDDDMMVCMPSTKNTPIYNFVYIDEALVFILSTGAKPWIELGHMPAMLAKNPEQRFGRPSILSMPNNLEDWLALIDALLQHIIHRFGKECVANWMFTPFFSPAFAQLGWFSMDTYMELYCGAFRLIRNITPTSKITSAPTGIAIDTITAAFWEHCIKEDCMPDIAAFNVYHNIDPEDEGIGMHLMAEEEAFPVAVSGDENFLRNKLKSIKRWLKEKRLGSLPICICEWSNNIWQRDLCNDTSYKSAYLFKNILENYDAVDGIGYWAMSDQMEEIAPSPVLFHGGFGLFTRKGLPKAGYRALQLHNHAGDILLCAGDGYFISRTNDGVQIFLYNYTHYDTLYRYRHTTSLRWNERYNVFNYKNAI